MKTGGRMDLRKVQRTSGGTFFVCLPKSWAEKNSLERGVVVAITEMADGRIAISPKREVDRPPRVAVVKPTPLLDREVEEKYLLGYDIIRVEVKERISVADRERVKQAVSRFVGLEIIEENYSQIVMQCLLEPSTVPPEKILRREYSIAAGMHRDAVTALIERDVSLARNVVARDNEVNRLYFLLVRILRTVIQNPSLSEKLGIPPIECLDYRLTASLVESIGDQSAQIAGKVVELGDNPMPEELSQRVLRFHTVAYKAHEDAITALFAHDVSLAESVKAQQEEVAKMFYDAEASASAQLSDFAPHVLAALASMNRIYDDSVDIADLVVPKIS
jgi:phosphate uptake regulator